MTKTSILLPVHDDLGQEARLSAAADLAHLVDGHLVCVGLDGPAMALAAARGPSRAPTADALIDDAAVRCLVEAELLGRGLDYRWVDTVGDPGEALRRAAAGADVIVVDRDVGGLAFPAATGVTAALLRQTSAAILATPPNNGEIDFAGRVLLAWDGSASAAAAMRAAVPLLRHAREVLVVEADDGSVTIPGDEAVDALAREGVAAVALHAYPRLGSAADTLLHQIVSLRPAYVVMGEYGHHDSGERSLGVATRTMLAQCHRALFLARD